MTSLVLAVVFLALYLIVWSICLLGLRTARNRYAGYTLPSRLISQPPKAVPGVTIIRPLCGLEDNLYNALESTMKLDYPKYQVIFALQSGTDEALPDGHQPVIPSLSDTADDAADDVKVGVNPKINNLMKPFEEAQYDLLYVIDSSMHLDPDALGRAVDAFIESKFGTTTFDSDIESAPPISDDLRTPPSRGQVGLVHHVPFALVYQRTWGSLIEQAFLNTTHAKMYLAINALAIDSCVMGKANLYSRANIASLTSPAPTLRASLNPPTGLAGFGPFLAEDNMIALSLWHELGLKHAMTSDVAVDFLGALSVRGYIDRRVRWIRVRKRMTPYLVTALEPFTESVLCGIYGSWAIARLLGANKSALFAVHMILWLMVDLGVRRALSTHVKGRPPESTLVFVLAWMARELMTLPIFLYGLASSDVTWRGKRYRIVQSGQ
ncbi:ceramide glucosyltransferase [Tremella mesenterica]|uniref:Ceramide glucosyltransferase n=1 Tax=Tremella mesenterica TaxID=5217 RepID=A0A4Q1BM09_TREME|nr:ceramide glucosyltransferase [Tremella mesenterica]